MTTIKAYHVEARQIKGFLTEVKSGNHTIRIDQPSPLSGDDGVTPLHTLLTALCGCMIGTAVILAHRQQISVKNIIIAADGTIDTDYISGKSENGRAGYSDVVFTVDMDTEMDLAEKLAYITEVHRLCPIADNLENGTPVRWEIK